MHAYASCNIAKFCEFCKNYSNAKSTFECTTVSGSQICADMHPNSTFPIMYDPNKGAEGLRPGRLWAPRDWRSFVEAAILRKMLLTSVTFFLEL